MATLPAEQQAVYILVKQGDGTTVTSFATGYSVYTGTLSGNTWEFTIDFSSGDNFTFATESPRVSLSVNTGAMNESG